jgi:DNA-binding NarL/FixJ family response regulator
VNSTCAACRPTSPPAARDPAGKSSNYHRPTVTEAVSERRKVAPSRGNSSTVTSAHAHRTVAAGGFSCPPAVLAMLVRRFSSRVSQRESAQRDLVLTARETQILHLLELGRSDQDIATHLSMTVHRVKTHVNSLWAKLGVATSAEAVAVSHALRRARSANGTRPGSSQIWL